MITYKPVIIPGNKRKDGTYPLKIRVTYKGKSRRLPTTMVCTQEDLTRSLKIKNPTILSKADDIIRKMRKATDDLTLFDIEDKDVDWIVGKIKSGLSRDFNLSFFSWCDSFCSKLPDTTRGIYVSAVNAFRRFLKGKDIDINDITRRMVLDFQTFIDEEPKYLPGRDCYSTKMKVKGGASSRYITFLGTIYNAARENYNDEDNDIIRIPKTPFSNIKKVSPPIGGQRNLGKDIMQRIISARPKKIKQQKALDVFVVSFALMGANLVDLYNATTFKDNLWIYYRQKTYRRRADKAEMRVVIPECISGILKRLQGDSNYILGEWHDMDKDVVASTINRALASWCKSEGIPTFTMYAARHTFASLARAEGIEKALVDECLAHVGDFDLTDIYAERSWDRINEAAEKVRQLFIWN